MCDLQNEKHFTVQHAKITILEFCIDTFKLLRYSLGVCNHVTFKANLCETK